MRTGWTVCDRLRSPQESSRAISRTLTNDAVIFIQPYGTQPALLCTPGRARPVQIGHVLGELEVGLAHRVEVAYRELDDGVRAEDGFVAVTLRLEFGQRQRRLAGIADLPPVPSRVGLLVEVFRSEAAHAHHVNLDAPLLPGKALFN